MRRYEYYIKKRCWGEKNHCFYFCLVANQYSICFLFLLKKKGMSFLHVLLLCKLGCNRKVIIREPHIFATQRYLDKLTLMESLMSVYKNVINYDHIHSFFFYSYERFLYLLMVIFPRCSDLSTKMALSSFPRSHCGTSSTLGGH